MALSWQLTIFYVSGMMLFAFVGWSMLPLMPARFAGLRMVILPLIGLIATCVGLSMLNVFGLSVSRGLVVLIVLCGVANVCDLYSHRRVGFWPPRLDEPWPVLWLFSLGLYVLTVSPTLSYGYVAPIGPGWDFEIYWPVAEYLKAHSVRESIVGPPNLMLVIPRGSMLTGQGGWGFSFVDAALGVLLGKDSSWTFTPMLGLVYSLLPLSVYIFARTVAALGRWASLLVAFLAGLNSLLLWTPYLNFGAQTLFLAISPLTIVAVDQALGERDWRSIAFGAIGLAAMLVAYMPGALLFALPLAALGASHLLGSRQRLKSLGVGAAVLALSVLPGLFGWQRALEIAPMLYQTWSSKEGPSIVRFLPISDWLGMTPFDHKMESGGWTNLYGSAVASTLVPVAKALTLPILAFSLIGLISAAIGRNRPLLATALPLLVYTLSLRFVERYPYGYLKAASCSLFALLSLSAFGFSAAWEDWSRMKPRALYWVARVLPATVALGVVSLTSYNAYVATARYYRPDSLYYRAAHSELPRLKHVIPAGASVYISGDERMGVPTTTLVSHLLPGREIRGRFRTGYKRLDNLEPGRVYEYAILHAKENPEPLGYGASRLLWRNDLVAVYERGSMPSAHVDMAQAGMVAAFSRGSNFAIDVDAAALRIGETQILLPPVLRGMARGQVTLGLVARAGQEVRIKTGHGKETLSARQGVSVYRTPPLQLPARIVIGTDAARRGHLLWVDLTPEGALSPGFKHYPDLGFVRAVTTREPKAISTFFDVFLGERSASQLSLDIWGQNPTDGSEIHYGSWALSPQTHGDELLFRWDPVAEKAVLAREGRTIEVGGEHFRLRDGKYSATMSVHANRFGRPDVCVGYPEGDYPDACMSGIRFGWNTNGLTGSHTVAIRVTDDDGLSTVLGPRTVTVSESTSTLRKGFPGAPVVGGTVRVTVPGSIQTIATRMVGDRLTTLLGGWPASASAGAAPVGTLDAPAPGAIVSGTARVLGWALDRETPSGSLSLNLLIDGRPVTGRQTRFRRPDVCAGYPESTYPEACMSGIQFDWNTNGLTGSHSVAIRVTDDDGLSTVLGPRTVTVSASTNTPPLGALDAPAPGAIVSGTVQVLGWALDRETPSGSLSLNLLIDGRPVSAPQLGQILRSLKLYEFGMVDGKVSSFSLPKTQSLGVIIPQN